MSTQDAKRKYGLILASARREQAAKAGGAGGVRKLDPLRDSDEDLDEPEEQEQDSMDWVQAALKKSGGGNSAQLAQQQRLMREALSEDASVFQYDELYDGMQAGRDTAKQEKKELDRKPKYIHNILKCAERRKIDKERRTEKKVQAEREAEKGMFDDKESFVTPAYLNKLEELKKAEQQERLEALIEEKNDAQKHKNMGLFYNHIFKQRMGEDTTTVKKEPEDNPSVAGVSESSNEPKEESTDDVTIKKSDKKSKVNQYRKRGDIDESPTKKDSSDSEQEAGQLSESDSSDSENETVSKSSQHRKKSRTISPKRRGRSRSPINKDSQSRTSRKRKSSSSSPDRKKRSRSRSPKRKRHSSSKKQKADADDKEEVMSSDENKSDMDTTANEVPEIKVTKEERIKKLFTKRTIGDKFIEAQQRYFQRKAERGG